jgi:outer membrane protein insertion porin family/translocation and assembly module TamA
VWAVVLAVTVAAAGPASASGQDTANSATKGAAKGTPQDTAHPATTVAAPVPDTGRATRTAAIARDSLIGRRARPEIEQVSIRGAHAIPAGDVEGSISTTESHCRGLFYLPFCVVSKSPYFFQRFYLDRNELRRDVLRIRILYWKRGYRLTSVDTTVTYRTPTVVRVRFTIHEGPPTRIAAIALLPDSLFPASNRRRLVRLRVNEPLDLFEFDTTATLLTRWMWSRGFADATIDTTFTLTGQPPSDSATRAAAAAGRITAGTAAVKIAIVPHRRTTVDTIVVTGNTKVSAQTIRHALFLRPGSLFLPGDVQRSQRALYQTGLFRRAAVTVDTARDKTDSAKTILVNVDEAKPREVVAGIGFTTVDFLQLSGDFTDYNWVGGARKLVIQGGLGNLFAHGLYTAFNNGFKEIPPGTDPNPFLSPTWNITAKVTQPWFLAPENTLSAGVFAHRRVAPGVYVDNAYGLTPTFTHDLADRAPLTLGYQYEVTHVDAGDVYFCVDYGVCDAATRDALQSKGRLSPLSVTAQIDRSDDPLNPTSGFVARSEIQYASQYTLSDFRYVRGYATASMYRPIGRSVLAFNGRIGAVSPLGGSGAAIGDTSSNILHPTARFYAGGSESVRGFSENQLGPRVLTIAPKVLRGPANQCPASTPIQQCPVNGVPYLADANFTPQALGGRTLLEAGAEYRFPIYQQFGGAVFVDAGIVGEGNLQTATSGTSAITPGFGIRYLSVVGPIRVDVGINPLTTERLVVLTEDGTGRIVVVSGPPGTPASAGQRIYAPARTEGGFQGLLNRVSLHLSIGQAF